MAPMTPDEANDTVVPAVVHRVGRAWRELRRGAAMGKLKDAAIAAGTEALEPGQLDTLDLLVLRDEWRMSDLADALRVDPSTATRAVQRLEKVGLAVRRPCGVDGRVVIVCATEAGRVRHTAFLETRRTLIASLLEDFDEDEQEQFAEMLERFVFALDRFVERL